MRAYDAIITELTDGPNVQKAKNQIQSAVKAIEHLIQDDQTDWAVEGFQMFQEWIKIYQFDFFSKNKRERLYLIHFRLY